MVYQIPQNFNGTVIERQISTKWPAVGLQSALNLNLLDCFMGSYIKDSVVHKETKALTCIKKRTSQAIRGISDKRFVMGQQNLISTPNTALEIKCGHIESGVLCVKHPENFYYSPY